MRLSLVQIPTLYSDKLQFNILKISPGEETEVTCLARFSILDKMKFTLKVTLNKTI
jgi:hypothetical protein